MQTQIEEQRNGGIHRRQLCDPNFSDLSLIFLSERAYEDTQTFRPFPLG